MRGYVFASTRVFAVHHRRPATHFADSFARYEYEPHWHEGEDGEGHWHTHEIRVDETEEQYLDRVLPYFQDLYRFDIDGEQHSIPPEKFEDMAMDIGWSRSCERT